MRNGLVNSLVAMAAVGAVLIVAASPAFGQEPPAGGPPGRGAAGRGGRGGGRGPALPPPGPVPRAADGHPNMSGYWNAGNNGGAVFEVQKHLIARPGFGAGNGAIVDPPDGMIPYQPWAAEKAKDRSLDFLQCVAVGDKLAVVNDRGTEVWFLQRHLGRVASAPAPADRTDAVFLYVRLRFTFGCALRNSTAA